MFCGCFWVGFLLSIGWIHFFCSNTCDVALNDVLPVCGQGAHPHTFNWSYFWTWKHVMCSGNGNKLFFGYTLMHLLLLPVKMAFPFLRCHGFCWPVPSHVMQIPCHKSMGVFSCFPTQNAWSGRSACYLKIHCRHSLSQWIQLRNGILAELEYFSPCFNSVVTTIPVWHYRLAFIRARDLARHDHFNQYGFLITCTFLKKKLKGSF